MQLNQSILKEYWDINWSSYNP